MILTVLRRSWLIELSWSVRNLVEMTSFGAAPPAEIAAANLASPSRHELL